MKHDELDAILQVMENPVRRKIIKRLSQEPAYALQLSKELSLGQPLVAKHLRAMEEAGLVKTITESSPNGPERRLYSLTKGVSITMDVGPNLFIERGTSFEPVPNKGKPSEEVGKLRKRVLDAEREDDTERLSRLSEILRDVDGRIQEIETERGELLGVRNQAMQEAARVATKFAQLEKRRVLFHILDEHDSEVERISEALNLREFSVRSILEELREYFDQ